MSQDQVTPPAPEAGGEREEKIQRAIDRWANAAVVGFQRESHMTLHEHVAWRMRSLVDEVSTLAAPRAREGEREAMAKRWEQLEAMAQAVRQGDGDEHAFAAWLSEQVGFALPAPVVPAVPVGWEKQEAAWFRWLRDNPQSAAYIAVLVAENLPHGPDLGASMNSGEVIGVMEDAKQPEYRYRPTPPAPSAVTEDARDAARWRWYSDRFLSVEREEGSEYLFVSDDQVSVDVRLRENQHTVNDLIDAHMARSAALPGGRDGA